MSGFEGVAKTKENAQLYKYGYDAGGTAAFINLLGTILMFAQGAGQQGTGSKVAVKGVDGKSYILEVPNSVIAEDGTLNRTVIMEMAGAKDEGDSENREREYKKPKSGTGKEKATDVPSWAKGNRPYKGESGKDFAKHMCDEYFGEGNYSTKGQIDYSKIRKWGDRGFE